MTKFRRLLGATVHERTSPHPNAAQVLVNAEIVHLKF